jgi:hypothetical protein
MIFAPIPPAVITTKCLATRFGFALAFVFHRGHPSLLGKTFLARDIRSAKQRKIGSERESVEESILGGFLKSDEFDLGRSQTLCLE